MPGFPGILCREKLCFIVNSKDEESFFNPRCYIHPLSDQENSFLPSGMSRRYSGHFFIFLRGKYVFPASHSECILAWKQGIPVLSRPSHRSSLSFFHAKIRQFVEEAHTLLQRTQQSIVLLQALQKSPASGALFQMGSANHLIPETEFPVPEQFQLLF